MGTRQSVLFAGGLAALVVLVAATTVFAAAPTSCSTKDYVVNVAMQNSDGMTSYTYSISSPTGKNFDKFFVYAYRGLQGDLTGTINGAPSGSYVPNGSVPAVNCPPQAAWQFDRDDDGYCFTNIGIGNQPKLMVSERAQPEEGASTVILGKPDEHHICGPILGPTTPAATFEGSPLLTTTMHRTFNNGCSYFLTVGVRDNLVTDATVDPATPNATVAPFEACAVTVQPGICETDLNVVFCPPVEGGRPPMQGEPGGTCYYPPNIKFTC